MEEYDDDEVDEEEEIEVTDEPKEPVYEESFDDSEFAATLEMEGQEETQTEKENDMEFIQSILEGEDELETILPEDLDNLPKVSRYNNDKDWL